MTPQSKLITYNVTDMQLQVQNSILKTHPLVKWSASRSNPSSFTEESSQHTGQEVGNSVACPVEVLESKILPHPGIETPSSKSFEQAVLAPTVQYNIQHGYE